MEDYGMKSHAFEFLPSVVAAAFTPSPHIVSHQQLSVGFLNEGGSRDQQLGPRQPASSSMGVSVYNISASSARVSWPPVPGCVDTFYSVMYHPNWNSILMGYKRKSFMHEDRIPVSHTSAHLANLLPSTAYFLCVTCQAANPVRDQCQVFSTLSQNGEGHDRAGWELATGVWLTCCVLLLLIATILLWGCLRTICSAPGQGADGCRAAAVSAYQGASGSGRGDSSKPHGLLSSQLSSRVISQGYELGVPAKLSGPQPV